MNSVQGGGDGLTDEQLIERWNNGDERAATALVARHADALARFAASAGERDTVDELVQDTFVRAFHSLDSFRGESTFRTWLFTIQRRLMLDRRRAERRERDRVPVNEAVPASEFNALDGVVARETAERVRAALSSLSELQRVVFTLRVEQGLSYREIAEIAATTEGAARVHYHNALRGVREFLNG